MKRALIPSIPYEPSRTENRYSNVTPMESVQFAYGRHESGRDGTIRANRDGSRFSARARLFTVSASADDHNAVGGSLSLGDLNAESDIDTDLDHSNLQRSGRGCAGWWRRRDRLFVHSEPLLRSDFLLAGRG